MRHSALFSVTAMALALVLLALASQSAPPSLASPGRPVTVSPRQPEEEETALRQLAEQYFRAYFREDVEGCMALFDPASQQYANMRRIIERVSARHERMELLSFRVLRVDPAAGRVDVAVRVRGFEADTGKFGSYFFGDGSLNAKLLCRKVDGAWKIRNHLKAAEDLIEPLVAAGTPEEQQAILRADPGLVNWELADLLLKYGNRVRNAGRRAAATRALRIAVRLAEDLQDYLVVCDASTALGAMAHDEGDYRGALKLHQRCLEICLRHGIERTESALVNIGMVSYAMGRHDEALEHARRAYEGFRIRGFTAGMSRAANKMGAALLALGDDARALHWFQESLRLKEEAGDRRGAAFTEVNIGLVYSTIQNFSEAQRRLGQAHDRFRALGFRSGMGETELFIGRAYLQQGEYDLALRHLQEARGLLEQANDRRLILDVDLETGAVYHRTDRADLALEHLRRVEMKARESDYRTRLADALGISAWVYWKQGEHGRALQVAAEVAALRAGMGDPKGESDARACAAMSLRALGRTGEAYREFLKAIEAAEATVARETGGEADQARTAHGVILPYAGMIELLVSQARLPEALAFAERAKARVIVHVLRSGGQRVTRAMTPQEREQEQSLEEDLAIPNRRLRDELQKEKQENARVAELNQQLGRARTALDDFRRAVYAQHPELRARRGEPPEWTREPAGREAVLKALRDLLPDARTALLVYALGEEWNCLFVVTRGPGAGAPQLRAYPLRLQGDLAKRVEAFRVSLADPNREVSPEARSLYADLLKPAERQLRGIRTLVVVPDGVLWELPFQALKPAADRYLIDERGVFYAPSLTALREMRQLARARGGGGPRKLLAFGDPALGPEAPLPARLARRGGEDRRALEPLPGARQEVAGLRRLYGPRQARAYLGVEAREERAKAEAGQCGVLHFATHGLLLNSSPLYSALVLAHAREGSREDGLLEAREIMDLELRADLAVLSACDTARGQIRDGEGVIGLAWAFFVAGCPTVVVSQWEVASESTSALMLAFHGNLRRGVGKSDALRHAALGVKRRAATSHPFHWAGFVVVGAGW